MGLVRVRGTERLRRELHFRPRIGYGRATSVGSARPTRFHVPLCQNAFIPVNARLISELAGISSVAVVKVALEGARA